MEKGKKQKKRKRKKGKKKKKKQEANTHHLPYWMRTLTDFFRNLGSHCFSHNPVSEVVRIVIWQPCISPFKPFIFKKRKKGKEREKERRGGICTLQIWAACNGDGVLRQEWDYRRTLPWRSQWEPHRRRWPYWSPLFSSALIADVRAPCFVKSGVINSSRCYYFILSFFGVAEK